MIKYIYSAILLLFPIGLFSHIQYNLDVASNEGDSIGLCADALVSIFGSNGLYLSLKIQY